MNYFDAAANTPLDKKVFKKMKPYLSEKFVGNSFAIHDYGITSLSAIEDARLKMQRILNCQRGTLVFNSGATEGNNTVIKGLCDLYNENIQKTTIIVSAMEHSSVRSACEYIKKHTRFHIKYIKPDNKGNFDMPSIKKAINDKTLLICLMAVNNELGNSYIHLLPQVADLAHKHGAYLLSDCTQAFTSGNIKDIAEYLAKVDYYTFSAHKIYGPTGVGTLVINENAPDVCLINGGAQELGLRGGTHNTVGIIGMSYAFENLYDLSLNEYYKFLYKLLFSEIKHLNLFCSKDIKIIDNIGDSENRHYNIISLRLVGKDVPSGFSLSDALINKGIACSAASACDNETEGVNSKPSPVLLNIGLSKQEIDCTARISFMKFTSYKDIKQLVKTLKNILKEIMH